MENNTIFELAEQLNLLQKQAVIQTLAMCQPVVKEIVNCNLKDKQIIEKTLDQLLEVAFDDSVLKLYKKLCRYYYYIDQEATVFYVQSYREMWDSSDESNCQLRKLKSEYQSESFYTNFYKHHIIKFFV
jgi:hypothetical protein